MINQTCDDLTFRKIAAARAQQESGKSIIAGYNRRFPPHILKMKQLLGDRQGETNIIATINAGFIPSSSWMHDPMLRRGGGSIISFNQIVNGAGAALAALERLMLGQWLNVGGNTGDPNGS